MRSLLATAGVCVIGAACAAVAALSGPPKPPAPASAGPATRPARPGGGVVVHEWGTFTGFAGSDGVHLPFRTEIGGDLPAFVQNRKRNGYKLGPKDAFADLFAKADGATALQRMETPVLYFYDDAPTTVDVRVDFPNGSLTEFYPPVKAFGPAYGQGFGEGAAGATAAGSFLDWGTVRVIPKSVGDDGKRVPPDPAAASGTPVAGGTLQPAAAPNHYFRARETGAALLQVTGPAGERHEERLLFYRGLGNFTLPVTLTAAGDDRFELRNAGPDPIGAAFLVRTEPDGGPTRFARYDHVAGRRAMSLPPTGKPGTGQAAGPAGEALPDVIVEALVAEGLYPREARAMVETWRASWLNEPGTRVLYTVPRPVTDALLPLTVTPTPAGTTRVLVGRIDVMTPEQERRLVTLVTAAAASTAASADAAAVGQATTSPPLTDEDVALMKRLGRFVAPALDRAAALRGGGDSANELRRALDAFYRRLAAARLPRP
ncbi:MAG: hypothetical protein JWO31_1853 [Phycisphaerales bacterium]|nr:hypothetical protein [Phycisphaerales bacterium]